MGKIFCYHRTRNYLGKHNINTLKIKVSWHVIKFYVVHIINAVGVCKLTKIASSGKENLELA